MEITNASNEQLYKRRANISYRHKFLTDLEARQAKAGGGPAADGEFQNEKNRLIDEDDAILDEINSRVAKGSFDLEAIMKAFPFEKF